MIVGLFPDWSQLPPYMSDGTDHYAEKVGDTQQTPTKIIFSIKNQPFTTLTISDVLKKT